MGAGWRLQAILYLKKEDPEDELVEKVDKAFKACMAKKLGLKDAAQVRGGEGAAWGSWCFAVRRGRDGS